MNSPHLILFILLTSYFGCGQSENATNHLAADFQNCLALAVEDFLVHGKSPSPEFGNITLEPYTMSKVTLLVDHDMVHFSEKLNLLLFHGFTDAKVLNLRLNLEAKTLEATFFVSNLTMEADFDLKGNVLGESIDLAGHLFSQHLNTSVDFMGKIDFYKISGKEFMKIVSGEAKWNPGMITERVESENKIEEAHLQKLIDEHYEDVFKDSEKDYGKIFNNIIITVFNAGWSKVAEADIV